MGGSASEEGSFGTFGFGGPFGSDRQGGMFELHGEDLPSLVKAATDKVTDKVGLKRGASASAQKTTTTGVGGEGEEYVILTEDRNSRNSGSAPTVEDRGRGKGNGREGGREDSDYDSGNDSDGDSYFKDFFGKDVASAASGASGTGDNGGPGVRMRQVHQSQAGKFADRAAKARRRLQDGGTGTGTDTDREGGMGKIEAAAAVASSASGQSQAADDLIHLIHEGISINGNINGINSINSINGSPRSSTGRLSSSRADKKGTFTGSTGTGTSAGTRSSGSGGGGSKGKKGRVGNNKGNKGAPPSARPLPRRTHQMTFDVQTELVMFGNDCNCNFWNELGYRF